MKSKCVIIMATAIAASLAGVPLKAQNMSSDKGPAMSQDQDKGKEHGSDSATGK